MGIDKNKLDRSSFKLFATGLNNGKVNDMATIEFNGSTSYQYLCEAVNDVSGAGTINVSNGPYVFHSILEYCNVEGKTVPVSMVYSPGRNTLRSDGTTVSITGAENSNSGSMRFELGSR